MLSEEERKAKLFDPEFHAPLVIPRMLTERGARPSAVKEAQWLVTQNPGDWIVDIEGVLVHKPSGLSAENWCDQILREKPWWMPTAEQADLQLAAFGDESEGVPKGNLEARGKLIKEFGEAGYRELMKAWHATEGSLAPGKRPRTAEDGPVEKPKSSGNNPFSPNYKQPDKYKRISDIIKTMGTKGAASMAKSAGVTLDGRPLK